MYLAGSGSAVIRTSKFRNGWNLSDAQGASRFAAAPLRRDRGRPLKLRSLEPASGLLGKEYAKEAESESDYHLHVRATDARGDGEVAEGHGASASALLTGGRCAPVQIPTLGMTGGRSTAFSVIPNLARPDASLTRSWSSGQPRAVLWLRSPRRTCPFVALAVPAF